MAEAEAADEAGALDEAAPSLADEGGAREGGGLRGEAEEDLGEQVVVVQHRRRRRRAAEATHLALLAAPGYDAPHRTNAPFNQEREKTKASPLSQFSISTQLPLQTSWSEESPPERNPCRSGPVLPVAVCSCRDERQWRRRAEGGAPRRRTGGAGDSCRAGGCRTGLTERERAARVGSFGDFSEGRLCLSHL